MNLQVLILPGINGSGPNHWQTFWEAAHPEFRRVQEKDWVHPVREEWVKTLEAAIRDAGPKTVLVAHSLACLQVAFWAEATELRIRSAMLVAPPDPENPLFPGTASGFSPIPQKRLPFPSLLVASSDDPYGSLEFNKECARKWGSRFIDIGPAGHINSDSRLGDWTEGFLMLRALINTPSRLEIE